MKSLIICALGSLFFGCHHQPKEASVPPAITNTQAADTMWKKEFEQLLPKLGHRNWILVVDKAFPLQSAPGIVTINTGEPMRPVLGELVRMLEKASHVKPVYYTDLELNSLSDDRERNRPVPRFSRPCRTPRSTRSCTKRFSRRSTRHRNSLPPWY